MLLFTILTLGAGCFPDGRCDEDQILSSALCLPKPALPPDAAPSADAGDAAPEPDGGEPAPSTFGNVCDNTDQCGGDTDLCAMPPGSSAGFCTHSACIHDTSLCPEGWICFDASAFVPDYSLCLEE